MIPSLEQWVKGSGVAIAAAQVTAEAQIQALAWPGNFPMPWGWQEKVKIKTDGWNYRIIQRYSKLPNDHIFPFPLRGKILYPLNLG